MFVVRLSGRQYDKDGNMRQWWNNSTIKAFRERAQCMIDQYSAYRLEPLGLPVGFYGLLAHTHRLVAHPIDVHGFKCPKFTVPY